MGSTPTLSDAIVIWTGWKSHAWPVRDEERLIREIGEAATRELLPKLRNLEEDFYSSDAVHIAADLKEMGDLAAARFRERHPELSEEAISALAWCYTFDWK